MIQDPKADPSVRHARSWPRWVLGCLAVTLASALALPRGDLAAGEVGARSDARSGTPPAGAARARQVDRLVVRKAERRLYLMAGAQILREYPIALGFQPLGHKRHSGDGRTPEGRYRIDWRNPASRYRKSLHISYPNPQDALRAQVRGQDPGGMIMIHGAPGTGGLPQGTSGDWTSGCIAVTNTAIDEIWALTSDGTPIEILP